MRCDSLTGWILANVPESRKLELYKLFQVWRESKPIATDNWRECGSGLSPFVVGCGNQSLWWRANFMTFYHFNQTSLSSFNKHYWEGEAGEKLTPWPLHYMLICCFDPRLKWTNLASEQRLTLKKLQVPWIPHNILQKVVSLCVDTSAVKRSVLLAAGYFDKWIVSREHLLFLPLGFLRGRSAATGNTLKGSVLPSLRAAWNNTGSSAYIRYTECVDIHTCMQTYAHSDNSQSHSLLTPWCCIFCKRPAQQQ